MRAAGQGQAAPSAKGGMSVHYKWIALSNTTLGILMVTINQSILLISLPALFRGIDLNPLVPSNTSYFLWIFLGFMLVTAVLVVSLGRVGDIYGRVRMYNLGFAVFTFFAILLSVTWLTGPAGALWIIIMRIGQGVGGAFLFANSTAILTDAFPEDERGKAMGINGIAAVSGSFLGLILGGVLAPIEWRLVFLVSVPFGLFGTIWAYLMLRDNGVRIPAKIDWLGNTLFALGLISLLTGIVYSLLPYGGHPTGWTNPWVLTAIFGGIALLVVFGWVETKVAQPMFRLSLFKIRAFTAGNIAGMLGALGRGGLQLMLIIWLQGIWLPLHGKSFAETPLWAGIAMIPLTIGFLLVGPLAGWLSDRWGPGCSPPLGLVISMITFLLLDLLPINFDYIGFAAADLPVRGRHGAVLRPQPGLGHEQPAAGPARRGRGDAEHVPELGHRAVHGPVLHDRHPRAGLAAAVAPVQGAGRGGRRPRPPAPGRQRAADRQPVLGVPRLQPDQGTARPDRGAAAAAGHQVAYITGRSFFPKLIWRSRSPAALHLAFTFAAFATFIALVASAVRGKRYFYTPGDRGRADRRRAGQGRGRVGRAGRPRRVGRRGRPRRRAARRPSSRPQR